MNPEDGVLADIDALIDEQLAAGEPAGGYDYGDPDFPRCPHDGCGREFHGLPEGRCPGSTSHGPLKPPTTLLLGRLASVPYDYGRPWPTTDRIQPWTIPDMPWGIPDGMIEPLTVRRWLPPRWWRLDPVPNDLEITIKVDRGSDVDYYGQVQITGITAECVVLDRSTGIEVSTPLANGGGDYARTEGDVDGPTRTVEIYAEEPPTIGDWQPVEPWQRLTDVMRRAAETLNQIGLGIADGLTQAGRPFTADPEPETPQQRALPRPSTTPPMWAHQPNRNRRRRR